MLGQRLSIMLAALWWGGITGLSFLAVPVLFTSLGSPAVAGPVAARLFSLQCWFGLLIGLSLLLLLRHQGRSGLLPVAGISPREGHPGPSHLQRVFCTMALVLLGMVLAMLQEFWVAHHIVTARATGGSLRFWHTLGSLLVLVQWLCSGAVLWRLSLTLSRPR